MSKYRKKPVIIEGKYSKIDVFMWPLSDWSGKHRIEYYFQIEKEVVLSPQEVVQKEVTRTEWVRKQQGKDND